MARVRMAYLQVELELSAAECEVVETALEAAGALAVTFSDPGDDPVLEPGVGETPLWERVRLTALFAADTSPEHVFSALGAYAEGARLQSLEDRAWERAWLDTFHPMQFGERLWVCPTTMDPPDPKAINLRLDPGLAFGTGTHPTTALCLRWLDGHVAPGQRVIDYGCGSGVLAIAALLLGARECIGIDNDPQALRASAENAARNGVSERLLLWSADEAPPPSADGVVANILASTLIELAPRLTDAVKPGGWLALSGILEWQVEDVARAYEAAFDLAPPEVEEGWILLTGRRRLPDGR